MAVHSQGSCGSLILIMYMYMINTQTLEKDKGKIYKSNPKATTFQRKIAASGGT